MKATSFVSLFAIAAASAVAASSTPTVSGDYLEVRSCDIYTGPCFANAEMNLAGKEGMMFWSVRDGSWKGTRIDGLKVMAVVKSDATLGNLQYEPRTAKAVLIVDARADARQKEALSDFAQTMAGKLISTVVDVRSETFEARLAACTKQGCASVKAGTVAEITTSCLAGKHDVCGNEETFYPPLTQVEGAYPVYTDVASFQGEGLNTTWQIVGTRSAFIGSFSASAMAPSQVALAR